LDNFRWTIFVFRAGITEIAVSGIPLLPQVFNGREIGLTGDFILQFSGIWLEV
jgi:hypothetical protein